MNKTGTFIAAAIVACLAGLALVSTGTARAEAPDFTVCDGLSGAARSLCRPGVAAGSHDRASRFEQAYTSHTQKLVLKNFLHVTSGRHGEYRFRPIFTNVLVVHPNIVLSLDREGMYVDDGLDKNGEYYYLYFVFFNEGVNSRVTLAKNLRPVSLEALSKVQREILRTSITELAKSGCGVVISGPEPLDKIAKLDLYPCVQQVFARSRG